MLNVRRKFVFYIHFLKNSFDFVQILVFTDSSHRDDDDDDDNKTNVNQMDVDLRNPTTNDEQTKISSSNSHTEISFICIRKPSNIDRIRFDEMTERTQCSLSQIYWLLNREKENQTIITNEMIQNVITDIKNDLTNIFVSVLKCGHYESQLAVYPKIKPAIL